MLLLLFLFFFFVLLLRWFFEMKLQTKMKIKVSFLIKNKRTVEMIIVNTPSKAYIDNYPILFLLFSCLSSWCVNFLKSTAIQKWNWRLVDNEQNVRTAEALIINTPLEDRTALTLCCCCFWCSIFCDVAAKIVSIKIVCLNFKPVIDAQTCTILKYTYYKIMITTEKYLYMRYKSS